MDNNEGYIKFLPNWIKAPIEIDDNQLQQLNQIRLRLIERNWLGVLPNGIGFGNISLRLNSKNEFLITGSATGHLNYLSKSNLARVSKVDLLQNQLYCVGLTVASSESMTHAVIYSHRKTNAVIHIHSNTLWQKYIHKLPTTAINAQYGTPIMAASIETILNKTKLSAGLIIMGGHEDGLIAFGENLNDAFQQLFVLT